jgi:hypothetical protein
VVRSHCVPDGQLDVELSQYWEFLHPNPNPNADVNTNTSAAAIQTDLVAFIRRFLSG